MLADKSEIHFILLADIALERQIQGEVARTTEGEERRSLQTRRQLFLLESNAHSLLEVCVQATV